MSFISEKDLYIFVFNPDKLSDSKSKEITRNEDKFRAQLDMLIGMKKYLSSLSSEDISHKIYERIKKLEEGSDILLEELLEGQDFDYFIYDPKSKYTF